MILCDMEEIGCGHRCKIFMEKYTAKLLARHRNCSIQQAMVSDPMRPTVYINGVGMEQQNIVHAEEGNVLHKLIR